MKSLLFVFLLGFAGCGGHSTESEDPSQNSEAPIRSDASLRLVRTPILGHLLFRSSAPRLKNPTGSCSAYGTYESPFSWDETTGVYDLESKISLNRAELILYLESVRRPEGQVLSSSFELGEVLPDSLLSFPVGWPLWRFLEFPGRQAESSDSVWMDWPTLASVDQNHELISRNRQSWTLRLNGDRVGGILENLEQGGISEGVLRLEFFQEHQGKFFLALPFVICSE